MNISEATPKSQPSTLPSVENPTAAHKAYKNRKNIILLPREWQDRQTKHPEQTQSKAFRKFSI
jgi:hypothetical protein